jgi:murein DD-endopeptidase MepM/ murein hydrolase activator NlpD
MMSYIKAAIVVVILAVGSYIGWSYYLYYTHEAPPTIEILGLHPDGGAAGDVQVTIKGSDSYKVGTFKVDLDDEPLVKETYIGKRSFSYPFTLSTGSLEQGSHVLRIRVTNSAAKQQVSEENIFFYVDNLPLQAAITKNETDARVFQGRTLHVEFQANKALKDAKLQTLSQTYPCFLQSNRGYIYECFVPIECEEVAQEYPYLIEVFDYAGETINLEGKFRIVEFPFKKQTIRVDKEKIAEEEELGLPQTQLDEEIVRLTKESPKKKLWQGKFIVPIELKEKQQITSDFGVIRATQERGLKQHKALDIIASPKSVVWASQDGVVVVKDRYAYSGNTVVIDHGYGILSLFFHLDEFANITVGDTIKKGNPVGTIGKTGYATGYHLHWEFRVNGVPVDPLEWTGVNF